MIVKSTLINIEIISIRILLSIADCKILKFHYVLIEISQYKKLINNINGKYTQDSINRVFNFNYEKIEVDKYIAPFIAFFEFITYGTKSANNQGAGFRRK